MMKNKENYILKYYQAIKDGSIIAGKWIIAFYEYIVQGLKDKLFFYDAKKAMHAIGFIESFVHHCESRNDLLHLELWQKALVSVCFGIIDEKGMRQFREILIVIGRKNGKTLLASAFADAMIYADGEFGAKCFCVAPKLEQADLVYSDIWETIEAEEELKAITKRRKGDYYIESTNSSFKKIAFNAKKSDGFNPHIVICDEVASWSGDAGLKQYGVMKSAFGARGVASKNAPMLVSITTSGYENGGIYDDLTMRATRFLMGDSREKRFAPFIYMIDDMDKWDDINELQKANPNMNVSLSVDYLLEEIATAEQSLANRAEFLCKHCCVKQNSSQAWLSAKDVEKCCGKHLDLDDFRGCYAVGGIDLSQICDLTACVLLIEKDGIINVFAKFWMPQERLDDAIKMDNLPYRAYIERGILELSGEHYVDYKACYQWFMSLLQEKEIYPLQIGVDRYCAQMLSDDLRASGFHVDDVFQGTNLSPIIEETQGRIANGEINIGDNDLLKIHFLNSALKIETDNHRKRLVKMRNSMHIDGMASFLDAMTMRSKYNAEIGEQLRNE